MLHRFDLLLTGVFEHLTGKSAPARPDWLADVLEFDVSGHDTVRRAGTEGRPIMPPSGHDDEATQGE